jgi:hypothetical protein
MNQHVATYPTRDGVQCLWLTAQVSPADELALEMHGTPLPHGQKLELPFRRIVLGIAFEPLFVTVVGERWFQHESTDETESIYVVLDEALDTNVSAEMLRQCIELKDRYRVSRIFAPTVPGSLAETLRRQDGLTHYPSPHIDQVARQRWPSFADFELTPGVHLRDVPSEETINSELNDVLQTNALDPKTGLEMRGTDGEPIPRILFLDDMPMLRTLQSVRTGAMGGCLALWNALQGLQTTNVRTAPDNEDHAHVGNTITGY